MMHLRQLLGSDPLENEEYSQHHGDCDEQANPGIADETGNDECHKGYSCYGQCIGQLSGNVVNVITLSTGRCHDGSIRNGGAVIAAYCACHAGGNADDAKGIGEGEYFQSNGDQYAEGAPAGACCKGQEAADKEHDGGQEGLEAGGGALYNACNIGTGAQRVSHGLEGPGKGQDQYGRNHGLEAFGYAAHNVIKGHELAAEVEHKGEYQCKGGAQHKANGCITIGEGGDEIHVAVTVSSEEAAGVYHADNAAYDEHGNGQHQVDNPAAGIDFFLGSICIGIAAGEQVAILFGVSLMYSH